MNDYASALAYLTALKTRGVSLGLDRMRAFVAALGEPHRAVPCVHVAGTNGKGSVAAMLEAILRSAGWRVGLYTSPHLVRLGERIQIGREILSEPALARLVAEVRPLAEALPEPPSYFEFMTGLAFRHFAENHCDIAVIEVGLGGRLDATNIVTPEVSIITSIGLDHCETLGATFAAIAAEKAGIIKPARPVVIGRLPPEAEVVIRARATELRAPVHAIADHFPSAGTLPVTNLAGDYQRLNAATATLAARLLPTHWRLTAESISAALQQIDWPARWQRFPLRDRQLVLDATHNAEGAAILDANLTRLVAETGRAPVIVAGVLGLDRARPLVEVFCRHAREIHFVVPAQRRACSFAQLAALVPPCFSGPVIPTTVESLFPAPSICTAGRPGDTVVVAGSIYLAGEVLAQLEPARGLGEGRMQDF